MSCNIRPARACEFPRILEIYENARAFMRKNGNPTQWGSTHPAKEMLLEDIRRQQLLVCEDENGILAVFFYEQGVDPAYVHIENGQWLNEEPYGVIHRIAVAQPGRGIVGLCIDWALEQCPNLRIDTHRDNIPMQRALAKKGFIRCGTVYVGDGLASIGFHKCLT